MIATIGQKELAARLGIGDRQLRNLRELGVVIPVTAGRFDPIESERRYRLFRDRDPTAIAELIDDLEHTLLRAQRAIARLSDEEPDGDEVSRIGPMVARADGMMRLVAAIRPASERFVHEMAQREIIGGMILRLLEVASAVRARDLAPINGRHNNA